MFKRTKCPRCGGKDFHSQETFNGKEGIGCTECGWTVGRSYFLTRYG